MSSELFKNHRRKNLSITDDFVFKYMYGQNNPESKQALMDILNVILDRNDNPIVDLVIRNSVNDRKAKKDKETIMDIRAETNTGELLNIEMQRGKLKHYADRSVFYSGELIEDSLQSGELYDKMRETIVISIIDGRFMPDHVKFNSRFYFTDEASGYILTRKTQLVFIELGKIKADREISELTTIEKLAIYFKYACNEDYGDYIEQIISETKEVAMSELRLRTLTEDEIQYEEARAKRLWKLNHDSELYSAKKEAAEEGRAEGKMEAKTEVALNMKNKGLDFAMIAEVTGLTIKEIEEL